MTPATMNCVEISRPGPAEVLVAATRPRPTPSVGEVLIKVAAAGINRPDVLQRQGAYPAPPGASDLPGLEVSGTIAALGDGNDGTGEWRIGDAVCALVAGGGYAEYVTCDARHCLPVPQGLTMIEAAALPETFFTVWHNVFERGALTAGEKFLVHGGTSGIGTTAIQLAKAMGATVYATANGASKCQACRDLGADRAIDYATEDFVDVIKAETGKGVDVILDMVGGDYIARNVKALAPDGRLVNIAFLKGSTAELNLMPVMLKRLTLTGSTLRPQSDAAKARMAASLRARVWPLIEAGRVRPVIHAAYPLAEAAKAHGLMETNAHIGKIVLTI